MAVPRCNVQWRHEQSRCWSFFGGTFDEFAVWRRSLSGAEINAIYTAGLAQQSIDQVPAISPPFLTVFRQGNDIVVSWSQNVLGYTLQSSPSLTPANWTAVAGVANNRFTATVRRRHRHALLPPDETVGGRN